MFYEKERSVKELFMMKVHRTNLDFPRHIHSSFEFIYVLSGEVILTINDTEREYVLTKDKAVLVFPYQIHSYHTKEESEYIMVIFSADHVNIFYNMTANKLPDSPVFDFSDSALACALAETDSKLLECSYLYSICNEFYRQRTFTEQSKVNVNLLMKIIDYVENNYTENITLHTIAEEYNYSYHYLSNFFNSNVGINFKRFLNEYRIHRACMLMRVTDTSISSIAHQSGYDNLRSFNREFLSITGATPSEYKRRLAQLEKN